jgi:hypothetical protein
MIMGRTIVVATVAALVGVGFFGRAQDATAQEAPREVPAAMTDPAIDFALPGGEHIVWPAPAPERRINKLFVVLPGAGNNLPRDWELVGAEAARLGYHTIALAYRNDAPLAQRCPGELASQSPADCAINLRREMIDGVDRPPLGAVVATPANGIDNRLTKLLQYLDAHFPAEEWSQFLDGNDPKWSQITISGHSLGAAEAVLIGLLRRVHRVVAFAGWADARHGWVRLASPAPTPAQRFFALIHQRDNFFPRTCYAYKPPAQPDPLQPSLAPFGLGLVAACPWPGFGDPTDTANPLLVENGTPPYGGAHVLVTNLTPRNPTNIADPFHPSPSRDQFTPLAADGTPQLVNAWRYLLGTDHDGDGVHYDADNCAAAANPDQTDTDGDDQGDACDPTPGNTPGKVTGGGWIGEAKNSFGLTAQYSAGMEAPKGIVTYQDKAAGLELKSVELTSVIVYSATRAVILGTAAVNGQTTQFRLEAEDHGEPSMNDTFRISWSGYEAGGLLNGGNIQIH